jgi:hypothetical protein
MSSVKKIILSAFLFFFSLLSLPSIQGSSEGDGTFYGGGGAGAGGACMLPPGFNGVGLTVAVAPEAFASGAGCGKCVKIWGEGSGLGMTPIYGPFYATIDNLCPECKTGDIDFGLNGDGRWRIHWDYISCDEARSQGNNQRRSLRGSVPEIPKIPDIPEIPEIPKIPDIPEIPVSEEGVKCKCGPSGCFSVNGDDCVRPGAIGAH